MNTAKSLYRSTLITAALALGCVGAATVARADEDGWRGEEHRQDRRHHDEDRGWYERGERGWHEQGRYRGYAPAWRRADRDDGDAYREGYRTWRPADPGIVIYYGPAPWYLR